MRLISNRRTLAGQLAILVVLAFAVSAALFAVSDILVSKAIGKYLVESDYVNRQNHIYAEKLQSYVSQNDICSTDKKALGRWARDQERIWFEIYDDSSWLYTSEGPFKGEISSSDFPENSKYYYIKFADGTFEVDLYGSHTYKFYNRAVIAELIVCFAVFFILVMAGVSRMIKYVGTLKEELEILEGGNLEYEVTIRGRNELAALGEGIEAFRKSILEQFAKEDELSELNSRMISSMSHDLRTPLTAVMLYAEAIKHGKYENEEQLRQYIDRIDSKLQSIKYLTDRIFEYSLERGAGEENGAHGPADSKMTGGSFREIFSDALSGAVEYLEQQGFRTEVLIEWYEREVMVYTEDLDRILGNIISNIVKYADSSYPVKIKSVRAHDCADGANASGTGAPELNTSEFSSSGLDVPERRESADGAENPDGCGFAGFTFENEAAGVDSADEETDSSGIGLRNVKRLVEKAGGVCDVKVGAHTFSITVMFRSRRIM
jgi:signal transduction histidine kinase